MRTAAITGERIVLGRDAGVYGRIARVLVGAWLLLAGVDQVTGPGRGVGDVALAIGVLAVGALFYTAVMYVLGDRVFARLNPWTSTALLLAPIVTVAVLDEVTALPAPMPAAVYGYAGLSSVLIGIAGYGGCEVVGLPVVVLRRRYTVYCAMNALDAAERPLTRASSTTTRAVTGVPALLGGLHYLLLQPLLHLAGVQVPFDPRWPVLLFLPAIVLLARAGWSGVRRTGWSTASTATRSSAAGALGLAVTALGILAFGSLLFAYVTLTAVIFLTGIAAAARQALDTRHRRPGRSGARDLA
ncbi:MAG: hypothetical protein GEV07_17930 [Streptosporangiales bacterium]|nr:hypothetical protein [Streptosporangiales bacterium]